MDEPKNVTEETSLSRRELLKALAAAGGALGAAAFLPGKWTKPLVEAGVLPAHAQGTIAGIMIEDLNIWRTAAIQASATPGTFYGSLKYLDPMQQVSKTTAKLHGRALPCGNTVPTTVDNVTPENAAEGKVEFSFSSDSLCVNEITSEYCVKLEATGRLSNELCASLLPVNGTVIIK